MVECEGLIDWTEKHDRYLTLCLGRHAHTGEKPFKCTTCPTVAQAMHLQEHVHTHSGAKPYQCTKCPIAYAARWNMAGHMRKRHPAPSSAVEDGPQTAAVVVGVEQGVALAAADVGVEAEARAAVAGAEEGALAGDVGVEADAQAGKKEESQGAATAADGTEGQAHVVRRRALRLWILGRKGTRWLWWRTRKQMRKRQRPFQAIHINQ